MRSSRPLPTVATDRIATGWAGPDDAVAIAALLVEVKRHYRQQPEALAEIEAAVTSWLDAGPGHCLFALARAGGEPAGLATVAVMRPATGLSGALYMKELFVVPARRGEGIGRRLLAFLAGFCLAEGLERIDFTTETWNEAAIRFYEREGAAIRGEKVAMRFDADGLRALADASPPRESR